jgi:hypothetical protein
MHGILRNTKQGTYKGKGKFKKVRLSVNIGEEDNRTEAERSDTQKTRREKQQTRSSRAIWQLES